MTDSTDGGHNGAAARDDTDAVLEQWASLLRAELGLTDLDVDIRSVLSLAGLAAHGVVRPAAPLTTFLVGYAAGAAATSGAVPSDEAVERATASARRLVKARTDGEPR